MTKNQIATKTLYCAIEVHNVTWFGIVGERLSGVFVLQIGERRNGCSQRKSVNRINQSTLFAND